MEKKMRILCLGDSIMQYNDCQTYPQTGWVQELTRFFKQGTEFLNFARNGRSTKSFIAEGRFENVRKNSMPGDYALIQFGHNDEKINDPNRYTSPAEDGEFRRNLEYLVVNLWAKKCRPILLTPVVRRKFIDSDGTRKVENTHKEYQEAIIETAKRIGCPCIDVTKLTTEFIEDVGEEKSARFFMNFEPGLYTNYPDGKDDNSHLRPDGAYEVSRITAMELAKLGDSFDEYKELSESIVGAVEEKSGSDREIDDEFMVFKGKN